MQDIEKLGAFYLGRVYDTSARQTTSEPLLYDSKDLVTHAVCVGMTGSGKTGLCIDLLEEAAIDGIPSLVIDPKGRHRQPAAAVPRSKAGRLRAMGQRRRRETRGRDSASSSRPRKPNYGEKVSRSGDRAVSAFERLQSSADFDDLHARQQRRNSDIAAEIICGSRRRHCGRSRAVARSHLRAPRRRCCR